MVPFILPFVIGLLVGAIVRKAASILLLGVMLVVVLSAAGYISFGLEGVYDSAMDTLPRLIDTGQGFRDALPYTSISFILGLAIGIWKA